MVKENSLKLNKHNYIIVHTAIASIYSHPNFSSELVTQALFWERLTVYSTLGNWYKIKQRDGYEGWIHSFYIMDSSVYDNNKLLQDKKNWYWVKNKFLNLSLKNSQNFLISYGSLIPCFKDKNQFFTILPNTEKVIINDCTKKFHVSPFIEMECHYYFRVLKPSDTISVIIDQKDKDGKLLYASQDGKAKELTKKNLLVSYISHPLMTFKIIAAIHYEALKLWTKGIRIVKKKFNIKNNISIEKNESKRNFR